MFKKNIDALRQNNPSLAEKLEKIDLEAIKDNIIVAEAETKDLILGYKDIALHSTFDPIREANALWNKEIKSELTQNDIQIVFGLGLGYLFKRAYVNAASKVFVIEPFIDLLRFVLEYVDFSAEFSDPRVYITDNTSDIINKMRSVYLQGDKAKFLFLPAYATLAKECMEDLTNRLVKIMEEKSTDVNTVSSLSLKWVLNFITNLPALSEFRPLGFFKEVFAGKSALIISPGPSLAENIEKIKNNREKFVIIAVGKALRMLSDNDIIPDFVTFSNATYLQLQLQGMEQVIEKSNIIMTPRTDHLLNSSFNPKNKILYLTETDSFAELFSKHSSSFPGIYKSASSISIISYFIAKALGFRNIAFVGLDLAFPDNKIYSSGEDLKFDEKGYIKMSGVEFSGKKVEYVKDRNGNDIPTRDDYRIFIRQFENILEQEKSLVKVINTSMNGAYISGMEYMEFDKFVEGMDVHNLNIDEIIANVNKNTKSEWNSCVQKVSNEIYSLLPEIKEIKQEAKSILDKNDTEQNFNGIRNRVMNNLILQNSLQGDLLTYTRDYKTQNLFDKSVIQHNIEVERKLISRIYSHSLQFINYIETSSKIRLEIG